MLFIAFGVGLDPRQSQVFGPALGPILIGFALGILTFMTGTMRPGYTGACEFPATENFNPPVYERSWLTEENIFVAMNPARCFGLLAATGNWQSHWIQWVGPILALSMNGMLYWAAPPYHPRAKEKSSPVASFIRSPGV